MTSGTGSYLGASVRRREDPRLLMGRGRFVADIALPHALHVAFVRSPFAHAHIVNIDTAGARAAAGVVAVVTAADIAGRVKPIRAEARLPGFHGSDWPILASDTVRYQGEAIAAVVATSPYLAEDAATLVDVDFEPLPVVVDTEAAIAADAPLVNPEWGDNLFLRRSATLGDVDTAFADADVVLRRVFRNQRYTGVPMETRGLPRPVRRRHRHADAVDVHPGAAPHPLRRRRVPRVPRESPAGRFAGRRRRVWRQGLALSRGSADSVSGAPARPARALDRGSQRRSLVQHPRPRAHPHHRARRPSGRHDPRTQGAHHRRLRRLFDLALDRLDGDRDCGRQYARALQDPQLPVRGAQRLHEQDAHRRLSRRRPSGRLLQPSNAPSTIWPASSPSIRSTFACAT